MTVIAPNGTPTTLSALRAIDGANEQPPPVDTTYVTRVGIDLAVGGDGAGASGGTNLINHVVGGP